jgi:hypothetical protein
VDRIQEWVALVGCRNFVSLLVPLGMLMEAAAIGPDAGGGIEALDRMRLADRLYRRTLGFGALLRAVMASGLPQRLPS